MYTQSRVDIDHVTHEDVMRYILSIVSTGYAGAHGAVLHHARGRDAVHPINRFNRLRRCLWRGVGQVKNHWRNMRGAKKRCEMVGLVNVI